MQGLLFDDAEERRKSDAEIGWELRRLKQAWADCSLEHPERLAEINEEIKRVTRKLKVHPAWWVVPACDCEECRELKEFFKTEEVK